MQRAEACEEITKLWPFELIAAGFHWGLATRRDPSAVVQALRAACNRNVFETNLLFIRNHVNEIGARKSR